MSRLPPIGQHLQQAWRRLNRPRRQPLPCAVDNRRIYVLPTPAGLFFATLVLAMSLGALNYGNNPALLLALLLAGAGLASALAAHLQLSGLVVAGLHAPPVQAGSPLQVQVLLQQQAVRTRAGLQLQFDDSPASTAEANEAGQLQATCALASTRRGLLTLPPLSISTVQPLGLVRAWTRLHPYSQCLVHPLSEHHGPALPPPANPAGHRPHAEGSDEQLRDYRPGDSRARIAWKASAHRQGLLVRQPTSGGPAPLSLDWQQMPGLSHETRISRLAHWVNLAAREQRCWSLQLPGQAPLGPANGHDHLLACLRALALMPDGR